MKNIYVHDYIPVVHCLPAYFSGLQAVDLFCWGIYRKYEHGDVQWYKQYANKILFETENLGSDQA